MIAGQEVVVINVNLSLFSVDVEESGVVDPRTKRQRAQPGVSAEFVLTRDSVRDRTNPDHLPFGGDDEFKMVLFPVWF